MTELFYPEDGIYNYCRNDLEKTREKLQNVTSEALFDIPSGFEYADYLRDLQGMLSSYCVESDNIKSKIKTTDMNFEKLVENLNSETNKMVFSKIKERDRIVK